MKSLIDDITPPIALVRVFCYEYACVCTAFKLDETPCAGKSATASLGNAALSHPLRERLPDGSNATNGKNFGSRTRPNMKRVQYDRYGGPTGMYIGESKLPQLGPKQVRVVVSAAAINPFDWKLRQGAMKLFISRKFPKGMGTDFAGVVAAVGSDVRDINVGDEVFGTMDFKESGAFAEEVVLDSHLVAKKPASLSFQEAACLPIPVMTAWAAIFDKAKTSRGSHLFINGCTGAVGASAVQLALARGVKVSGACGTASLETAKAAGLDSVFSYADSRLQAQKGKFDAVFDTLGTLDVGHGLSMLKKGGVFVDINPTLRRVTRGMLSRRYKLAFATMGIKRLSAIADLASEGVLRPTVGLVVPFADAVSAITAIECGTRIPGKVVLSL
ncbi:NADPH:quinone reductase-like Zn-dependent oxidoreductase [Rhizobium sp. BK226]|uniref:NAD(P)-dependent alcohol dehydrogenase n=1 Tax=Rhizobium sp. BK226 TaxID=2587075 RepID=UPI00179D3F67|nr:NAD(P)-dependent alcohol dehydrogenase [Rhizobium sp. BK226]MBB4113234.1 NADPH:quinone reductase-like Zn-dependent oxidoreductase [Rhizobium sp. BK226]